MYIIKLIESLFDSSFTGISIKTIIVFLCVAFYVPVRSQTPYFKKISFQEGLPATNIYDILNDSKGYIWFATDNGVTRYDGFEFENFTTSDGLAFNSTLALYEDYLGRIWFLSYSGKLSYFEEDRILEYECNDLILHHFLNQYIDMIHLDSAGGLWMASRAGGVYMIDSTCHYHEYFPSPKRTDSCYLFFYDMGTDHFITTISDSSGIFFESKDFAAFSEKYFIKTKLSNRTFMRRYLKLETGNYLIGYGNKLFHIKDDEIICRKEFNDPITSLTMDNDGNIWLSTEYGGGVSMYPKGDIHQDPVRYFDGYTVTKVLQDRENNYWFATSGNGVFFTPTIDFNVFPFYSFDKSGLNIIALQNYGDTIFFSSTNQDLYKGIIENGKVRDIDKLPVPGIKNWIFNILIGDDGTLWLSNTKYQKYNFYGQPLPNPVKARGVFELARGANNRIYLGYHGFQIVENDKVAFRSNGIFNYRVYAMTEDEIGDLWLGTLLGLFKYRDSVVTAMKEIDPRMGCRINDIVSYKDYILVGTGSDGLFVIKNDTIRYHLSSNKLPSNVIREICIYNDSTIWLAMNSGLVRMVVNGTEELDFKTEWISINEGLPTSEIHEIKAIGEYIWLGTNAGLVSFREKDIRPSNIPPIVKISEIVVDGISVPAKDSLILGSGSKNIRIFFKGISFKGPESIRYRYQLAPLNDAIISTSNDYADFPGLPPGDYTFFVNARYPDGKWHEKPQKIFFTIEERFIDSIWFRVLRIIFGVILLLIIIHSIIIHFKRREEARKKLIRLEQRFYRSQLNPHFIFNSLMAIQGIIYQQETKDAVRYLSSFAKLIRYIITIADLEFVLLDKEIMFIRNFLELQKLRFKDKFDYEIKVDPAINPDNIQIPPMMAQPFLENSIEHGIQNKDGKGRIFIELRQEDHYIIILIEDDGIGREQAKRYRMKKRIRNDYSSTDLITDRIILLNELMERKAQLSIEDLFDNKGAATGTRVIITLPIIKP